MNSCDLIQNSTVTSDSTDIAPGGKGLAVRRYRGNSGV